MRHKLRATFHLQRQAMLTIGLLVLLVLMSFMAGFIANLLIQGNSNRFPVLREARELLKSHSYNNLPQDKQLEYGMIRGMLAETNDPYTVFIEPSQHELQTNQLEGTFGGIGVRLERDQSGNVYLYPLPDSPALQAGIKDGDKLISVEGTHVDDYANNDQLQAAIRGKIGTQVELHVQRSNDLDALQFQVKRAEYRSPSVTYNLSQIDPLVGVINISLISETTAEEIKTAVLDLQSKQVKAVILDLRNNGGGLVEGGAAAARLFLPEGDIIYEELRDKGIQTYSVTTPGPFINIPLAILVNHNTASAAEILAAALQSKQRAIIVGTQTLGKNTVQLSFTLSDQSSIHITSGRWWVAGTEPAKNWHGLFPDILLTDEEANGIVAQQRAIEALFP